MVEISRLQEVAKEFYQLISPYEMDLRDKWKTEGLEEERTEGLEKLRNSAANFKKMGLPLEQIAEATGLALDEVNAL